MSRGVPCSASWSLTSSISNRRREESRLAHHCSRPRRSLILRARQDETEFAVFRFTLGIPGLEDRYIPRIVGSVGLPLLALNRVLSVQPVSNSQTVSELVAVSLCVFNILIPYLGKRLDVSRRSGRRLSSSLQNIPMTTLVSPILKDELLEEIGWAVFATLRNTNSDAMIIFASSKLLAARGSLPKLVGASHSDVEARILGSAGLSQLLQFGNERYYPDLPSFKAASIQDDIVLDGMKSGISLPITNKGTADQDSVVGWILLLSSEYRAYSPKERKWAAAVVQKISSAIEKSSIV